MRISKFGQNKVGFPAFHSDLLESTLWWQLGQVLSENTNMRTKVVQVADITENSCALYKGLQGSQDRLQQRKEQEQEQMTLAHPGTYILARRFFQVSESQTQNALCLHKNQCFSVLHGSTEVIICQAFATGFVPLCEEGWLGTDAMVVLKEFWESWWFLKSIPSINQKNRLWDFWFSEEPPSFSTRSREVLIALPWGNYRMTPMNHHPDPEYSSSNHKFNPLFL